MNVFFFSHGTSIQIDLYSSCLHFPLQLYSCLRTRYFPARSTTPFRNCLGGIFDEVFVFRS